MILLKDIKQFFGIKLIISLVMVLCLNISESTLFQVIGELNCNEKFELCENSCESESKKKESEDDMENKLLFEISTYSYALKQKNEIFSQVLALENQYLHTIFLPPPEFVS
ncbi:MAG: hypothetical protein ACPG6V_09430 [Flavobacteriales bacterium]